jgi:formate dehydrogenase major subunit/formate dehydrogenase alpha subunit
MSNSMDDVSQKAEAFFIIGSNTSEQHPVFGTMLRRAVRFRGAKLIVADPRRIDIVDFATLHLQHRTGTDIALINGLMHIILKKGWEDKSFIAERTEDFESFRETVLRYTPEKTAEITGVPIEKLYEAAEIMGKAKPMAVLWAMGITQHITGVHNVFSLANLQMLLGNMGVPGGGVNPLRGQNNVQGACDLGGLPNVYAGYQKVTDPANQEKFERAWGVSLSPRLGLTATELVPGILEGKTSAFYVMAENPVMSEPDTNHVRKSFEQLDFLVLQEIFPTETAAYADVLLPGVSFAEKVGTFTNTERRIQMIQPAIPPLGDSRPDWQIITEIAKRMLALRDDVDRTAPFADWNYASPSEVMDEVNALTPIYGGVTHARLLAGERLQWPCTGEEHPGTPILHVGRFSRGLGKFHAVDHVPPAEQPDDDYPFVMSTGRVLYHWHGGEMTRRTNGLNKIYGEAMVEVNPEDALRLNVTDEDYLEVTSRRGSIQARVWVTDRVPMGMVYTNFHFPESSANVLTQAVLDPIAKIPEYKVTAVRVEKI